VKAAVPAVGGAGWCWQPYRVDGGIWQQLKIKGDADVFGRTLSFASYAPLIRCPVMHRSAGNRTDLRVAGSRGYASGAGPALPQA
jgi:hypothetical protein